MKRYALLLSAALGMAAAQTPTVQTIPATPVPATGTSPASAPRPLVTADPGLTSANVSFNIRQTGNDMSIMLVALAKSAGYDIVLEPGVDAILTSGGVAGTGGAGAAAGATTATAPRVSYNFVNKPFNEVWPLVLDLYGLSYETLRIGERSVLRVTAKPIQRIVRLPRSLSAALVERQLKLSFGSVKTVSSSQSNTTAQGTSTSTTETPREEITLDSPTMRIVAEPASNSVIIRGTNQEVAQVERLLADIVAVQPPGLQAATVQDVQRIYTVKGAQADVTALLGAQYPSLRVTAAGQSGRVVITGPQAQVDAALALLGQVDLPAPSTPAATTGRSIYTVRGVQADVTALLAAQYPDLKVTPIGQTGRVVITGSQPQINAALALLEQVDTPTPTTPTASAGRSVYAVKGQQADIAALLGAQYPDLKVTPVGQTGQLILTGPQGQIDAALTLLGQVDRAAPSPQATVQRVFQLVNASAEEVKATLEGTLARDLTAASAAPSQVNIPVATTDANGNPQVVTTPGVQPGAQGSAPQSTGTAGGQPGTSIATIIADKRTNTLIVRGTSAQVAQIAELVPNLDQVVPQINVQVRIQEITETAARSLGVDWRVNVGGFSVNFGGNGLGATFDPTRSLVGFNIFPTLQALENQGFTKRVYDGNITMQSGQRSLGSTTATQNASSTASASIKSGGRLEINIPSQAANVASIQKQIDYGVNLDFFDPQVAPDGTVTLRVRGQVNNLAGELPTTDLPTLLNFTNSEAQSTITFKSGQTVLMSGLLGTTESRTNGGVPFLSSLPVIGAAFGKQSTNRSQTQLLVIITGSVVK